MIDKKFFLVIKNDIKCAFCKEPNCYVRYKPDYSKITKGIRGCKKDAEKRKEEVLKRKLP